MTIHIDPRVQGAHAPFNLEQIGTTTSLGMKVTDLGPLTISGLANDWQLIHRPVAEQVVAFKLATISQDSTSID